MSTTAIPSHQHHEALTAQTMRPQSTPHQDFFSDYCFCIFFELQTDDLNCLMERFAVPNATWRWSSVTRLVSRRNSQDDADLELQAKQRAESDEAPMTPCLAQTHRDALGRVKALLAGQHQQWLLNPDDAKLISLKVQHSESLRSHIPWVIELLNWTWHSKLSNSDKTALVGHHVDGAPADLYKKWLPASFAMLILLFIPTSLEANIKNGGQYDRVQYRDWCYADTARNPIEDSDKYEGDHEVATVADRAQTISRRPVRKASPTGSGVELFSPGNAARNRPLSSLAAPLNESREQRLQDRGLGPTRLFFLHPGQSEAADILTYELMDVEVWRRQHPTQGYPEYCFVSYTSEQFPTATIEEMASWTTIHESEREARAAAGRANRSLLAQKGAQAALRKGVPAFWLDFECQKNDKGWLNQPEIWLICDIVRAAHSMIIVCGPAFLPVQHVDPHDRGLPQRQMWLSQWSARVWTIPELLFCPSETRLEIHTKGTDEVEILAKRNVCRLLKDGDKVRELMDHYESTIHLTPLELVSLAAECLFSRSSNTKYPGDVSYALMGLLRRRPKVDTNDSDFKAFARLSLANDSDRLLERLVCMQPLSVDAAWHSMADGYGASLWDIEPCCQVAGIIDPRPKPLRTHTVSTDHSTIDAKQNVMPEQTPMITLDGAFGAAIQWDTLRPVAAFKRQTAMRTFAKLSLRALPVYVLTGVVTAALGETVVGAVILSLCLVLTLSLPITLLKLYKGKFWSTQAHFYGMQGVPQNLGEVERCLFGLDDKRLTWSAHGSMLSRAVRGRSGELMPLLPETESSLAEGRQIFTIIDTFALTASAFYAERPPTAVIICGQEGGMQRALLCSYDPTTRSFCKETVLRMKTLCLERMSRMDRFRFTLRTPQSAAMS